MVAEFECRDVDFPSIYAKDNSKLVDKFEDEAVKAVFKKRLSHNQVYSKTNPSRVKGTCPCKPGFVCGILRPQMNEAAMAKCVKGVCYGEMCPVLQKRIVSNPRIVLGNRSMCDPDEFSLTAKKQKKAAANCECYSTAQIREYLAEVF